MSHGPTSRRTYNRRHFAALALGGVSAVALGVAYAANPSAQDATPDDTASGEMGDSLTVYCGRNEELIGALIPQIEDATGLGLNVRYGNTAELAAQILEEGDNSPAGLYFGQDAGSIGALALAGRLTELPDSVLDRVDERFRSPDGLWAGVSGRTRVLVYNPDVTDPETLPEAIADLPTTDLEGPIGWAPSNASFQSFVTALRVSRGEDETRQWLEDIAATDPIVFDGNNAIVDAAISQEIAVGLTNDYYLNQRRRENPYISAENYFFPDGDLGSLINVAGVGALADSGQEEAAFAVAEYLLSEGAQQYFADNTGEYPLIEGVESDSELPPLEELEVPDVDLTQLDDLEGTLALLTELGLI